MNALKKVLIGVVAFLVIFVVIGFILPSTRHVERSIVIDAPVSVVFAKVNGLRNFNEWSPFVAEMPDAHYLFEGPDFGVGSKMTWETAGAVAESGGRTIIASTPYDRVDVELDLGKQGTAQSAFLLQPQEEHTDLTWTFETDFGFNILGRYRGVLLDRQLGPTLSQGLTNLKRLSEALPKVDWSDIEIGISVVPSITIAYATGSSSNDPTEISAALAAAYGRVLGFVSTNGMQLAGKPLAITNFRDDRGYGFEAGIPVDGNPGRGAGPDSPVRMGETYGGRVVRAVHVGAYSNLEETYEKVRAFAAAHDLQSNGRSWEVFVSDPGNVAEKDLVTEIFYPVK